MSNKAANAYRTISEVADMVGVKPHVLRFWEKKFVQIKPLKRESGRRYYRPEDVRVIEQIKELLHNQGYTVRGVQQLFKQKGVKVFQLRDESLEFGTMITGTGRDLATQEETPYQNQELSSAMREKLNQLYDDIGQCLIKYPH